MIIINLHRILTELKMSQADLARLTGIRPSTICDIYHNNIDFIKLDHLSRICEVLNCKISDFFTIVS